ncbi:MAG: low specificity L-threonine aldolase, partial [Thermomicrobiales bacterium]
ISGIAIDPRTVETNLVFFDVSALDMTAIEWCAAILAHGVRMNAMGPHRVRAVTHLDVDRAAIDRALAAARAIATARR